MNIERLDLNLLNVFDVMFHERNVTRAARRLGITQPAVSNALRRLRGLLADPLFIRTPGGMIPTPRAMEIGPAVVAALAGLREAVSVSGFDPTHATTRFSLGALDYLEPLYLPGLVRHLAQSTAGAGISVHPLASIFDLPATQLESGAMDCAVGLFPQPLPPRASLHGKVLFLEDWVCIARRDHPQFAPGISLAEYAALKQVAINLRGNDSAGLIDRLLAERGLTRQRPIVLPHFSTVPFMVAETDCIATVPRSLAQLFATHLPLQIAETPVPMPEMNISLVWHARTEADAARRWFREAVAEGFGSRNASMSHLRAISH